jgi:hypothetical protein
VGETRAEHIEDSRVLPVYAHCSVVARNQIDVSWLLVSEDCMRTFPRAVEVPECYSGLKVHDRDDEQAIPS